MSPKGGLCCILAMACIIWRREAEQNAKAIDSAF